MAWPAQDPQEKLQDEAGDVSWGLVIKVVCIVVTTYAVFCLPKFKLNIKQWFLATHLNRLEEILKHTNV